MSFAVTTLCKRMVSQSSVTYCTQLSSLGSSRYTSSVFCLFISSKFLKKKLNELSFVGSVLVLLLKQEQGVNITANSLHPGSIMTNLLRYHSFINSKNSLAHSS